LLPGIAILRKNEKADTNLLRRTDLISRESSVRLVIYMHAHVHQSVHTYIFVASRGLARRRRSWQNWLSTQPTLAGRPRVGKRLPSRSPARPNRCSMSSLYFVCGPTLFFPAPISVLRLYTKDLPFDNLADTRKTIRARAFWSLFVFRQNHIMINCGGRPATHPPPKIF
jgi:hypothetical protein